MSLDVSSGGAPVTVQFSDTSQGPVTSWQWDLGDGASSKEQNPTHQYTEAGSHTVRLLVSGPGGTDMAALVEAINVNPGPLAEVVVSTSQITLQVQDTTRLSARAFDEFGNEISDAVFTWGASTVGSVDETGLFTAGTEAGISAGLVKVAATRGAQSRAALIVVTVDPGPLSTLVVEPAEITLDIGAAQPFTFRALDEFGNEISDVISSWSIVPEVGTIDDNGVLSTGTKAGSFPGAIQVEVAKGAARASATVNVSIRPDSLATIEIQPVFIFVEKGATQQFTAAGFDQYGNETPQLAYVWEATGGKIDQAGLFTADVQPGPHQVRASATFRDSARTGSAAVPIPPVSIFVQVGASTDDAYHDPDGFWPGYSDNRGGIRVGAPGSEGPVWGGWRWTGLGIPSGAIITDAYVEFNQAGWGNVLTTTLAFENTSSPSPFSPEATPYGRWGSRTTFEVDWTWAKETPGTWIRTPSLVAGIQELLDKHGDLDGLVLLEDGTGVPPGSSHEWIDYDRNPTLAARLHIEFTAGPDTTPPLRSND